MSRNPTLTASIATAAVAVSAAIGALFLAPAGSPSASGTGNMPLHVRNMTSAGMLKDADVDTVIYKVDCDQSGANCKLGKEVAKKTKAEFTTKLRSGEYLLQAELSADGKKKYKHTDDSDGSSPVPADTTCRDDHRDCIWIVVNGKQWGLKSNNGIMSVDHADFEYWPGSGTSATSSEPPSTVVDDDAQPVDDVSDAGSDEGIDVDIAVTPEPVPVVPDAPTAPAEPQPDVPVEDRPDPVTDPAPEPDQPVQDQPVEGEPVEEQPVDEQPVEDEPVDAEASEQELIDQQPVEDEREQEPIEEDVDSVFANPLTLGVPND